MKVIRKVILWVLLGVLGLAVVALVLLVADVGLPTLGNRSRARADAGTAVGAHTICKQFVRDELVSPRTAKFPLIDEARIEQIDVAHDRWQVTGYVDAQNRMGATIRADYTCVVTYQGNDTWYPEQITVAER